MVGEYAPVLRRAWFRSGLPDERQSRYAAGGS